MPSSVRPLVAVEKNKRAERNAESMVAQQGGLFHLASATRLDETDKKK